MNIAELIQDLKDKKRQMEEEVFTKPPTDMEELRRRQGIWLGLTACQQAIDARTRKENTDD